MIVTTLLVCLRRLSPTSTFHKLSLNGTMTFCVVRTVLLVIQTPTFISKFAK